MIAMGTVRVVDIRTLVLEKIAHPSPSREDELRYILDDLRLLLRREGGEPFRKPLFAV